MPEDIDSTGLQAVAGGKLSNRTHRYFWQPNYKHEIELDPAVDSLLYDSTASAVPGQRHDVQVQGQKGGKREDASTLQLTLPPRNSLDDVDITHLLHKQRPLHQPFSHRIRSYGDVKDAANVNTAVGGGGKSGVTANAGNNASAVYIDLKHLMISEEELKVAETSKTTAAAAAVKPRDGFTSSLYRPSLLEALDIESRPNNKNNNKQTNQGQNQFPNPTQSGEEKFLTGKPTAVGRRLANSKETWVLKPKEMVLDRDFIEPPARKPRGLGESLFSSHLLGNQQLSQPQKKDLPTYVSKSDSYDFQPELISTSFDNVSEGPAIVNVGDGVLTDEQNKLYMYNFIKNRQAKANDQANSGYLTRHQLDPKILTQHSQSEPFVNSNDQENVQSNFSSVSDLEEITSEDLTNMKSSVKQNKANTTTTSKPKHERGSLPPISDYKNSMTSMESLASVTLSPYLRANSSLGNRRQQQQGEDREVMGDQDEEEDEETGEESSSDEDATGGDGVFGEDDEVSATSGEADAGRHGDNRASRLYINPTTLTEDDIREYLNDGIEALLTTDDDAARSRSSRGGSGQATAGTKVNTEMRDDLWCWQDTTLTTRSRSTLDDVRPVATATTTINNTQTMKQQETAAKLAKLQTDIEALLVQKDLPAFLAGRNTRDSESDKPVKIRSQPKQHANVKRNNFQLTHSTISTTGTTKSVGREEKHKVAMDEILSVKPTSAISSMPSVLKPVDDVEHAAMQKTIGGKSDKTRRRRRGKNLMNHQLDDITTLGDRSAASDSNIVVTERFRPERQELDSDVTVGDVTWATRSAAVLGGGGGGTRGSEGDEEDAPAAEAASRLSSQPAQLQDLAQLQALIIEKKLKALEPVRHFNSEPVAAYPCVVCFDYLGTDLTHPEVIALTIGALNASADGVRGPLINGENLLVSIQFEARNAILGTTWCTNRWILTLVDRQSADRLIQSGLDIRGEKVRVRRHDDVAMEEYRRFRDYQQRVLNNAIQLR